MRAVTVKVAASGKNLHLLQRLKELEEVADAFACNSRMYQEEHEGLPVPCDTSALEPFTPHSHINPLALQTGTQLPF